MIVSILLAKVSTKPKVLQLTPTLTPLANAKYGRPDWSDILTISIYMYGDRGVEVRRTCMPALFSNVKLINCQKCTLVA